MLWNSLLKQAQANWEQSRANALAQARANEVAVLANDFEASRANLAQARANEESSRAIHLLAQRMPSMGAIEVVPDRLESWYAAKTDAEAGITIAEQIAEQAEGLQDPRIGVGRGEGSEVGSRGSKLGMIAGRSAPAEPSHLIDAEYECIMRTGSPTSVAKTAVGTKRRPSVLELLFAGGRGTGGRDPVTAGEADAVSAAPEVRSKQRMLSSTRTPIRAPEGASLG